MYILSKSGTKDKQIKLNDDRSNNTKVASTELIAIWNLKREEGELGNIWSDTSKNLPCMHS